MGWDLSLWFMYGEVQTGTKTDWETVADTQATDGVVASIQIVNGEVIKYMVDPWTTRGLRTLTLAQLKIHI